MIAVGIAKDEVIPSGDLTGVAPNIPVEVEEESLETPNNATLPEGWSAQDCVDEIMVQLFDVVNELQGLR